MARANGLLVRIPVRVSGRRMAAGQARRTRRRLADLEELDVEDERGAARDRRRLSLVAVGDGGRAHDLVLLADLHLLHGLGPAGDDAAQGELRGLAALHGAVEDRAVDQPAL